MNIGEVLLPIGFHRKASMTKVTFVRTLIQMYHRHMLVQESPPEKCHVTTVILAHKVLLLLVNSNDVFLDVMLSRESLVAPIPCARVGLLLLMYRRDMTSKLVFVREGSCTSVVKGALERFLFQVHRRYVSL